MEQFDESRQSTTIISASNLGTIKVQALQQKMTINQPDAQNNFETTVLSELRQINQRLDHLETDVGNLKLNLEKVDYKFDTYQKASDSMVRLATTIIVAAATVAVLPSALSAISPLINALITGVGSGT